MFKTLLGKISNKYKTLNEWNGTYSLLVEAKELSDKTRANRLNYSNHILAEFGEQGIDTKQLLGHSRQSMTDMYNNDRGLTKDQWKVVKI